MKFTCQVDINLPIKKVIELFDNPDNMKHWQDGLVSFKHLSGRPGEVGAKSRGDVGNPGDDAARFEVVRLKARTARGGHRR